MTATDTAAPTVGADTGPEKMKDHTKSINTGKALGLIIIFVWCLFPFIWMAVTSFKTESALVSSALFQGPWTDANYQQVFAEGFAINLRNSLIVAGVTTLIAIPVASFAAYAIVRLPIKHKFLLLAATLVATLFPPVSLVPPLFTLFRNLGLLETFPSMIVPYISLTLPLSIFILTTFFGTIPKDMEEAARVDGATPWQAFYRVVVPLAAPGVFAAAILVFVYAINEFLIAFSLAPRNINVQTVPVAIAGFQGSESYVNPIGPITAASTLVSIPLIIVALLFQRRIVSGLTAGGVKG
ncbi:MAG: carbohydrate ABC transporter permease [Egibacteraceae bacterium]